MPNKPYFPFYPNDFSADGVVEAMSTEAVGAYILLLCKAWNEDPAGSLPQCDRILSAWARVCEGTWAKIKDEVLAAFELGDDGRFYQKRMTIEAKRYAEKCVKASESAKVRWGKRRNANALPTQSERYANQSQSQSQNQMIKKKTVAPAASGFWKVAQEALPALMRTDAMRDAWGEWEAHRREIRKTMTPRAAKQTAKKIAEMNDVTRAIAAIEHSIANSYTGLYEEGRAKGSGTPGSGGSGAGGIRQRRAEQAEREGAEDIIPKRL